MNSENLKARQTILNVSGIALFLTMGYVAPVFGGMSFTGYVGGGGQLVAGGNCTLYGSVGILGGSSECGSVRVLGQEGPMSVSATYLAITANPPIMPESGTGQLSGVAVLDDGTVNVIGGGDIGWGPATYPLASLNEAGLITAANVYCDTNAVITAHYLGADTSICVVVLDTNPDDYGIYAGDQIPDWWQVKYFGTNNALGMACATNRTGRSNMDTYIADLNPTNPSSIFEIAVISNASPTTAICFASSSNCVYALIATTNLMAPNAWTNVTDMTNFGNGGLLRLSDTNVANSRFYRVRVGRP